MSEEKPTIQQKIKAIDLVIENTRENQARDSTLVKMVPQKEVNSRLLDVLYTTQNQVLVSAKHVLISMGKSEELAKKSYELAVDARRIAWLGFAVAFFAIGITIIDHLEYIR